MTKLALASLLASARLEELAQHRLWIDPKGHLLYLNGLEERRLLPSTLLFVCLLLCAKFLFLLLGERFARLACQRSLRLDLGNLLLHLSRLVFLFKRVSARF